MKLARTVSLALLAFGALMLVVGIACSSGGEDDEPTPTSVPTEGGTTTPEGTATATTVPTWTPTPPPFDGKISRIKMPKFSIDAPIEELGIVNGQMDTPKDTNRSVGWYYDYSKPGFLGNAIFSAHVYYRSIPAPFVNLAKSVDGDKITVQMENGTEYTYEVISNERFHRDTIDMGAVIWPPNKADYDEYITLITCGGELDSTGQEYLSRDVIVAKRIFQ